jgi:hypothetical protein
LNALRTGRAKHLIAAVTALAGGFAVGFLAVPHPVTPPDDRSAASPLVELIPQVQIRNTTVGAAFDYLRQLTSANLVMDWRTLGQFGITPNTPLRIDLRLHDVSLAQVLSKFLSAVIVPDERLDFEERNGIVLISTGNARTVVTKTYDVRDLLGEGGKWERLAIKPGDADPATQPTTIAERAERLTHLLVRLVDPESWRDNGGMSGAAMVFLGRLTVTQTPENHDHIAEVLQILRDANGGRGAPKGK